MSDGLTDHYFDFQSFGHNYFTKILLTDLSYSYITGLQIVMSSFCLICHLNLYNPNEGISYLINNIFIFLHPKVFFFSVLNLLSIFCNTYALKISSFTMICLSKLFDPIIILSLKEIIQKQKIKWSTFLAIILILYGTLFFLPTNYLHISIFSFTSQIFYCNISNFLFYLKHMLFSTFTRYDSELLLNVITFLTIIIYISNFLFFTIILGFNFFVTHDAAPNGCVSIKHITILMIDSILYYYNNKNTYYFITSYYYFPRVFFKTFCDIIMIFLCVIYNESIMSPSEEIVCGISFIFFGIFIFLR